MNDFKLLSVSGDSIAVTGLSSDTPEAEAKHGMPVTPSCIQTVTQNSPDIQASGLFASLSAQLVKKVLRGPGFYAYARYRNVTIWARVQEALGLKVVAEVPLVTPQSAAQLTGSA